MNKPLFLCLAALVVASCGLARAADSASRPNIVLILVDDMPWFGTPVRMDPDIPGSAMAFRVMPNVEKLAAEGMTFRNCRAAAGMCGPSRCSIMTGMMTARHLYSGNGGFGAKTNGTVKYMTRAADLEHPLIQPEPQGNIRFPSIGDVFKADGYATAHFGKWHLYGGGPAKHGFDESDGETDNGTFDPTDPVTGKRSDTSDDPKLMFSVTKRSIDFMDRQAKAGKPFYLQISHYATHARYQARKETLEKTLKNPIFAKIEGKAPKSLATVGAAMAEDLDTCIGTVLQKLDELGLSKSTYVFFTADNGYRSWNESYEPLRGAKWWIWECGVRVPLIVRGPGIQPKSRTSVNVVNYDFLPTFADLAGVSAPLSKDIDGTSFKPLLMGQTVPESYVNRAIYFHYPHYRISPPCSAIVMGDMKLLHFYEWPDDQFTYNVKDDLGETKNLAKDNSQQAAQMYDQMMERLKAVGAYFPKPNAKAPPHPKIYDPKNLADKGDGDDPEAGEGEGKPVKAKKGKAAK